jgi:dolichyl-phosphate-mannose--protein O-mannosyl transferase
VTATTAAPAAAAVGTERLARIRARLVVPMPADRWLGWLVPLAVTGLAAYLRFHRLATPHQPIFDETYYAHDSFSLLKFGAVRGDHFTGPEFDVHPPLGKWMMAFGEWIFNHGQQTVGDSHRIFPASAFSWRFAAAVIGTVAVLLLCRAGRRMFRSTTLGCLAGLLLALDGLEFVQSRTGMLDIFLMFWLVAALACLVADRDDGRRRLAGRLEASYDGSGLGPWLGMRWWRLGAAVCLGAAVASKWSGLFFIPLFVLLGFAWDAGARRVAGVHKPARAAALVDTLPAIAVFVVVPAAVYVASYTGWFLSDATSAWEHDKYVHPGQSTLAHTLAVAHGWLSYQIDVLHFHEGLHAGHPYLSTPYTWIFLGRPVAYYYTSPHHGMHGCHVATCSREVLAIGTPAIWWSSILALGWSAWTWLSKRDWRAAAILGGFAAGYLVWFAFPDRTRFFFYALPALPFLCLALALCAGLALGGRRATLRRRALGAVPVGAVVVLVVLNFFYLAPILTAQTIPYGDWQQRMWFQQCANHNKHQVTAPCWI